MEPLKYKVIKSTTQYNQYCKLLEGLVTLKKKSAAEADLIELLQVLIEKYDRDNSTFSDAGPIEALRYLMKEHGLKSIDLAKELAISPSLISDILHRRRGLSKENIRKLSARFSVDQELFNRPYDLMPPVKKGS